MTVRRRLAVALVLLVVAAACGDDSTGTSSPPADSPTPTTTPPAVGPDVAPVASAGCGTEPTGIADGRVDLPGDRWYLVSIPDETTGDDPLPLVVDLHGYSAGAEVQAATSRFSDLGRQEGFLTVTPQGSGPVPQWGFGPDGGEIGFVADLLDDVEARLCVDRARVFFTGLSNGAMMTTEIACEMADRVAAVGPVAGLTEIEPCDPTRPVPLLTIHGTDDGFVSFTGGIGDDALALPAPDGSGRTIRDLIESGDATSDSRTSALEGPPIEDLAAEWAARNGCGDTVETTEIATTEIGTTVERRTWDCPADATTELVVVDGGGHTWPGSELMGAVEGIVGFTTMEIDATDILWDFFVAHARPPADA